MTIKKNSFTIGILILSAYLMLAKEFTSNKLVVISTDVLSGFSVISIALLLKPYLQKTHQSIFNIYLVLKFIEGTLMILGGILFLGNSYQDLRSWIYETPHLFTFIVSGFAFYYLLFKSRLVPRFISIWGIVAIFSLLAKTILATYNITNPIIDSLLILTITNEIALALWLIIKGFNKSSA